MSENSEVMQWITVNGHHIPIYEGESVDDAITRRFNDDRKRSLLKRDLGLYDDNERKREDSRIDKSEKTYRKYSKLSKKEIEKLMDDKDNLTDEEYSFLKELRERKGEEEKEKQGKVQNQISKDLDKKEKQIQQNEEEGKRLRESERRAIDNIVKGVKRAYGHADEIDGFKTNDKLTLSSMFSDKKGNFINDDVPVKIVRLGTKDGYGQNYNHAIVEYKNANGQIERQEIPISRLKKWQRKK